MATAAAAVAEQEEAEIMSSRALTSDATPLLRAMLVGGLLTFASCAAILHTVNLTGGEASGAAIELRDADRSVAAETPPAGTGGQRLVGLEARSVPHQGSLLVSNEQAAVAILAQLLRQRYGDEGR